MMQLIDGLLLVVALGGFYWSFFRYIRELVPATRLGSGWYLAAAICNTLLTTGLSWLECPLYLNYALLFAISLAEIFFLVQVDYVAQLLLAVIPPYLLICAHGIMIPMLALLYRTDMYSFVGDRYHNMLTVFWTAVSCILLLRLQIRMIAKERMLLLLRCRSQRRLVCFSTLLLFAYLLVESYVYYYNFPLTWTPIFHMITSILALLAYGVLLWYAVDVSSYIEYELKTRQIGKQLQRQVVHYQQYTRYISSLRTFKHDCRSMVAAARRLIAAGATDKAQALLGQMGDEIKNALQYTPFSNHVVVDAILQECAGRCEELGVRFSAGVSLPDRVDFNDLELCRIFGNLIDNAFEACEQIEGGERFISLQSSVSGDWVTVEISNSYAGEISLAGGLPTSRKHGEEDHGLGLLSVRTLVESRGGFLRIEVVHPGIFTVHLHLSAPLQN